jgi:hypothetical protein
MRGVNTMKKFKDSNIQKNFSKLVTYPILGNLTQETRIKIEEKLGRDTFKERTAGLVSSVTNLIPYGAIAIHQIISGHVGSDFLILAYGFAEFFIRIRQPYDRYSYLHGTGINTHLTAESTAWKATDNVLPSLPGYTLEMIFKGINAFVKYVTPKQHIA